MTEDNAEYEIRAGECLVLEPGKTHWGHQPCSEPTDIYWVHFKHEALLETLDHRSIPWSSLLQRGTDFDQHAAEQYLYLPKYMSLDFKTLIPVLEDMLQLHSALCHENAIQLHALLGRLLSLMQAGFRERQSSRSFTICEQVKSYLHRRFKEPFDARQLADELHFDFDYAARCLKKHTGMSPLQYQHHVRMEEAKRLLHHTVLPVQEIAESCGFSSYNYFIRIFRKTVGITPGVYRDRYRGLI